MYWWWSGRGFGDRAITKRKGVSKKRIFTYYSTLYKRVIHRHAALDAAYCFTDLKVNSGYRIKCGMAMNTVCVTQDSDISY